MKVNSDLEYTEIMEKRITEGKYVPSGFKHETYHCSVCDFRGTTATWKAHDGEEGFWCYVCRQKEVPVKSALKMVMVDSLKWVRAKVEVKCCGEWLDCDRFTNTCELCGTDYNGSGQQLAPREQWGEETGETADDLIGL